MLLLSDFIVLYEAARRSDILHRIFPCGKFDKIIFFNCKFHEKSLEVHSYYGLKAQNLLT